MIRSTAWLLTLAATALVFVGCGDEEEAKDKGQPPTIHDLEFDNRDIPVGRPSNIDGQFMFEDPDGDLATLHLQLLLPGGQAQELPPSPLTGVAGKTEGTAIFLLAINPVIDGEYFFNIDVQDSGGNFSEPLSGSVRAVLPQ